MASSGKFLPLPLVQVVANRPKSNHDIDKNHSHNYRHYVRGYCVGRSVGLCWQRPFGRLAVRPNVFRPKTIMRLLILVGLFLAGQGIWMTGRAIDCHRAGTAYVVQRDMCYEEYEGGGTSYSSLGATRRELKNRECIRYGFDGVTDIDKYLEWNCYTGSLNSQFTQVPLWTARFNDIRK